MKEFKFNEQLEIENMIASGFVDISNINNTIYRLAKYNYHVLNLPDNESYRSIILYVTSNCPEIIEEMIYKNVDMGIKRAKNHSIASVDEVCITESEINIICSAGDIKKEKILFVLLAVAKYLNQLSGNPNDNAYLSSAELFKLARVTIPSSERDVFMQFAYDDGYLIRHFDVSSTKKKLSYVSHNDNDKIIMRLEESDFKDLAYTYLAYLEPHKFRRCHNCRRWMRRNKDGSTICRVCKNVADISKIKDAQNFKTGICEDCGKLFIVDVRNTTKTRCDKCQNYVDKENTRKRVQKYREEHKNVTLCPESGTIQN